MSEKTEVGIDTGSLVDVFDGAQAAQGVISDALVGVLRAVNNANASRTLVPLFSSVELSVNILPRSRGEFLLTDCRVRLGVEPYAGKRG